MPILCYVHVHLNSRTSAVRSVLWNRTNRLIESLLISRNFSKFEFALDGTNETTV